MKTLAVIPSRYASTRFPGKPLIDIDGKSMIQSVYEQVSLADRVSKIVVATDDDRIFDHVESFGGEVMMTNLNHPSGTDRCAEVARQFTDFELVINVQGDEPFIKPAQINDLIIAFQQKEASDCGIGTMIKTIEKEADLFNPNVVKVVRSNNNRALYFSRQAIPYLRGYGQKEWLNKHLFFKHIGIYIFRSKVLQEITKLPVGKIEKAESLEQLRWLENGFSIYTTETKFETFGIDTPDDLLNWQKKAKSSK
jgi:3-deoxy-manno-octulosonate cytidylyltransferase (CMP-KDO synthetase)